MLLFKLFLKSILVIKTINVVAKSMNNKIFILLNFNIKISFDANEVIYMNRISIPPTKIKNKE